MSTWRAGSNSISISISRRMDPGDEKDESEDEGPGGVEKWPEMAGMRAGRRRGREMMWKYLVS